MSDTDGDGNVPDFDTPTNPSHSKGFVGFKQSAVPNLRVSYEKAVSYTAERESTAQSDMTEGSPVLVRI